jgi:hypothetical protein
VTAKIFINYRRGDDSGFAQALFIRLEQVFSHGDLFMDVDSIAPGEDFVQHLDSQIALCDVLLAIIGKGWADAVDGHGQRRLDDPDDFVRIEIASALRHGKRIIPILLHDARMPSADQLPEELHSLARRQAVRLTHERFRADTDGLIRALQGTQPDAPIGPLGPPPRKAAMPVPAATPAPAAVPPVSERLGIAARVEQAAARYEAINFGVITLISAFLLIFGSYMAGVVDVEYKAVHKQVGFVWAPNWSVNYLILFVAFNCLFCLFVNKVYEVLAAFRSRGIIVGDTAAPITDDDLAADWRHHLRGMSPIIWVISLGVPFIAIKQWFDDCYKPLVHNDLMGKAVDWGTIAIVPPKTTSITDEIIFTAVAFAYMAVSLWIYLFVLAYAASFAWYLSKLSRGTGRFRLIFHARYLPDGLRQVLQPVFILAFLGYLTAYCMRLRAYYLVSPDSNIFQAMFATESALLHGATASPAGEGPVALVTSAWTCWPVFIYATVVVFVAFSLLQAAYGNARNRSLAESEGETSPAATTPDDNSFWHAVAPSFGHWVTVSLLLILSITFPTIGSLLILSLCCVVAPILWRWLKPSKKTA